MGRIMLVGLVVWVTACSGLIDTRTPVSDSDAGTALPDGAVGVIADAGPDQPDAAFVDPNDVMAVCNRWRNDRADRSEGTWTGSVATCDAGDVIDPGRPNALRLINLYRWLAGLPPVTNDSALDAAAQECALMQKAHGSLSHTPTPEWQCYTTTGANAAGLSNISSGPGVRSIDAYMADIYAPTSLGHRRWILSNSLGPVGLGSTDQHSCLHVIGGSGNAPNPWTAFPSPGLFPVQAIAPGSASVDAGGWSIQSNAINLNPGVVTVTAGGQDLPVTTTVLSANYGSAYALRFVPDGWSTQANTTYRVSITNIATPIEYDVVVIDCP